MDKYRRRTRTVLAIFMLWAVPIISAQTKEAQAALTPQQAFELLKEGNERFVRGELKTQDLVAERGRTAPAQYPYAVVVSCLDSRTAPEWIFDQGLGEVFTARVAGNVINEDILGSLEFATAAAGAKVVAVIGHSDCGAVKGACDGVQLGHLTTLLQRIQPAVDAVGSASGERTSKNKQFVEKTARENVRQALKVIRADSPVLNTLLAEQKIMLVGGMYDLKSGKVEFLSSESTRGPNER